MPADLQAQPGAQRLIQDILLVTESTADIGLNHPDQTPVDAQRLADDPADDVRDLGGGGYRDPLSLFFGKADEVLNMAVLHHRRFIPAFHLDEARLLNRLFIVALADLCVFEDIVGELFMQQRRAVFHGFLHVQHEGIFLILHPDQAKRLRGSHLVLRHHRRDVVSVEAHAFRQDQAVCHVLVGRIRGPGMSRRREIMLFLQVETGQDLHHAGNFLSL